MYLRIFLGSLIGSTSQNWRQNLQSGLKVCDNMTYTVEGALFPFFGQFNNLGMGVTLTQNSTFIFVNKIRSMD